MTSIRELAQNDRPKNGDTSVRIVDMNDETAVSLFKTLADETTLQIYTELQQEPKTAPELKDLSGTTIQNIHYHLDKLEEADLIEPVDTWVSDTGKDMDVYGTTHNPLIISFSAEQDSERIRSKLRTVLGMIGGVSLVGLVVEYLVEFFREPADPWTDVGSGGYSSGGSPIPDFFFQYPGLCVFVFGLLLILGYLIYTSSFRDQTTIS